ncbi:right-handed parallel beta-helix repeat-containing protein [Victivallis vadensis]|uniref:Parallel beta helix pectate lyase-like protein n=2 Tax=Victivallis vadensis TaxID=172901 RepID=A0A2U1B0B5_9BACT|nr:right-handed parallel beta-helix repeat-containing protein [Victivallis vadensis]PVY42072.1 parallel beta helix pectate lyase-like protein [Victivallis vadensis]
MKNMVDMPQLFPAEVSAWDEDEKERRAAAGREVLEQIRRAGRDGSGTVRIPPGDYRFPGREGMLLENLRDISLEAEGATFWFSPEVTAGVHFRNCRNVRLSGLALDMEELPFLQGILLEVGEERLVIRLEEYFRRRFHEQRDQDHFRLMFLDVAGECETDNLDFIVPREKLSLDAAGNLLVPVSEPVARHWRYQLRVPRPGDRVVLGMRHEGGMLLVDGCEAMCFEAVTVYASPCFAFYEIGHGGGGNTYRGCRLIRRPGTDRLLASAADCFHSMNQRRGPLIEQCEFSWAMDDFVNIHGYFHVVLEQLSEDELLIVTPFGTGLQPGTELTFFSAPYGREKFRAAVVSRQESAGSEQEGLRRVRELYGRKFGIGLQGFPGGSLCRVRFDRPLDTEPGDFACDYDNCGSGAVIRCNHFHDCHVRGILLKAADCRIEDNRIERTALNGIILKPEFFWLEGPMPRNIVIRGNTLTDCAFGHTALAAILVMCGCCAPPADRITPVVNMEGIVVAGNLIRRCNAGAGIAVFNSRAPRVSDNRIEAPFANPTAAGRIDLGERLDLSVEKISPEERGRLKESRSAIVFLGCAGAECRGNTVPGRGEGDRAVVYAGSWGNAQGQPAGI